VECNDEEVLRYNFSLSAKGKCLDKWTTIAKKIRFMSDDTASRQFRGKPGEMGFSQDCQRWGYEWCRCSGTSGVGAVVRVVSLQWYRWSSCQTGDVA